jgi:hypothetical protein
MLLLLMHLLCFFTVVVAVVAAVDAVVGILAFVAAIVVDDVALKNPAAVLSMSKDPRYFIKLTIPVVAGLLFLHGKN